MKGNITIRTPEDEVHVDSISGWYWHFLVFRMYLRLLRTGGTLKITKLRLGNK